MQLMDVEQPKQDGFNRYMVECESFIVSSGTPQHQSFNRYMVECE